MNNTKLTQILKGEFLMNLSNENIIHIKNNGLEYIQFRKLLEYEDILTHCFTLKPLDFGDNGNFEDKKDIVENNYKLICNQLNTDYKDIIRPYQTHTNNIKEVGNNKGIFLQEYTDIDGLITDKPNNILSLTFADCTPIYLFDPDKKAIGNIHSGWQGTVKQIVKFAIKKMINIYGSNPKDIICAIGPTIRKCHFEVEDDVKEIFLNQFKQMSDIITKGEIKQGKQKYYIDTVKINKNMLMEMGVLEENIIDSGICTVCNSDLIHSYRKEGNNAGRNTAIIMLK